jgi:spore cortex formation protein SpoVR/YcgB (stage V sporulation)
VTETVKFDSGKDWTFGEIETVYLLLDKIAREEYGLDVYPNQIEIITSEQMLDAYSAVGMPTYYSHWSFGKQFVKESEAYKRGRMGLAYEIVINSNPCISYLMEENTMAMQALVVAHANFGHNSFFKNNVNFKQWTDADAIIDYLVFAKHFVAECEEKYGWKEVERVLDAAHALRLNGIDRYKRPAALSKSKREERRRSRLAHEQEQFDDIWRTIPVTTAPKNKTVEKFPKEPEENVLYFIEKHAPNLDPWKRELIRIVRKTAQYFYPQMLTKIMNEGWATFWHYTLMNDLYDRGFVTDGFMFEFIASHTGVIKQRQFHDINPYALGFAMFQDIKRISMEPTDEDREWFFWAGNKDWLSTVKEAAYNFKDESFIFQYLSPKVMRDFGLFYILDNDEDPTMVVEAIQDEQGYRVIREKLAEQQNVNNSLPYIQVTNVDVWGDRSIELQHVSTNRHTLSQEDTIKTLRYLSQLWGYPVQLRTVNPAGKNVDVFEYDPNKVDLSVI